MRISSVAFLLAALSACSSKTAGDAVDPGAERIACALGDAKTFTSACVVERISQNGKSSVIIRHPDGSFRRFEVLADGRSLATTDGADPVEVTPNGKDTEITVGDDHYLFPASNPSAPTSSNAKHP
ncbi:MAG: hypothetical protein ABIS10_09595 [Novosphingobium sp.]